MRSLGKREEINVRASAERWYLKPLDYALSTGTIALQSGHWFLGGGGEKYLRHYSGLLQKSTLPSTILFSI